jgi:hypothetical protein
VRRAEQEYALMGNRKLVSSIGGLDARRTRLPVYIVGLPVSVVILLILGLDRSSGDFIEVSQQPMIDTAQYRCFL